MRLTALGVIAITSTMTFACTMTETRAPAGGSEPTSAKPSDLGAWRSKLALTKRKAASASKLTKLSGPKSGAPGPMRVRSGGAAGGAGGAGGTCGLATGDATCDACLGASCCAPNAACVGNADCTALVTCMDACRDDACFGTCLSAHPTGAGLLDTLSSCVETSCSAACGGPSSPPSGSACGFASGDATCDTCLDTSCCGAANACLADADCTALLDCAEPCADDACFSACEAAHPTGATKLGALSTCATTTCGSACGAPPSGPAPGSCGLTSGAPTCDACLDASCCGETTACLGDADCVALVRCYGTCADGACAAACDAAHPGGATKLTAVYTCAQTSCAATCGL